MSANAFADDIQCSLDAGMNAHIPKPVDEKTLLAVVEELLAKEKKSYLKSRGAPFGILHGLLLY